MDHTMIAAARAAYDSRDMRALFAIAEKVLPGFLESLDDIAADPDDVMREIERLAR